MIRLESESRISPAITPRGNETSDAQISLLRSQLETLRIRLAVVECGLLKLDERTLSSGARQTRKKAAASDASERCRINANAPLQIFAQP